MGTGDGNGGGVIFHHLSHQLGAFHHRQSSPYTLGILRIVRVDRGRIHDEIDAGHDVVSGLRT